MRQTVLWLNGNVAEGAYDDPLTLIKDAAETSSERFETYELLRWSPFFGQICGVAKLAC